MGGDLMATRVFISWSGELSRRVAELLNVWIGNVLQGVATWISTEDIDKGSIWFAEIGSQLAEVGVGVICLTPENITAPWILFEAGALSKGLTQSRVCPIAINIEPSDLKPPLSQFNVSRPRKDDMLKLIKTINSQNGSTALSDEKVKSAVEKWWDDFERPFDKIIKSHSNLAAPPHRTTQDVLDEILAIVRSIHKRDWQMQIDLLSRQKSGKPYYDFWKKSGSDSIVFIDPFLARRDFKLWREVQKAMDATQGSAKSEEDAAPEIANASSKRRTRSKLRRKDD